MKNRSGYRVSRYAAVLALLTAVSMATTACVEERPPPMWSGLEPGPRAVGFQVSYVVDSSRTYWPSEEEGAGRPIRMMLWYPGDAEAERTSPMTFGEYVDIEPGDPRWKSYNDALRRRDLDVAQRQFSEPTDSLVERLLALQTAVGDIPPADGQFPLVVHSLGRNNYQAESTVLWEYLASHGYVVAVVPQVGATPEDISMAFTLDDLDVQLRDVAFALSVLALEPYVDSSRTAVIGHSSGAVVGLRLASQVSTLDALVSLDGSIMTTDGRDILAETDWTPETVSTPLLNLYAAGKRRLDTSVLDGLQNADRYHVALGTGEPPYYALHFDFQNWPIFSTVMSIEDARATEWRSSATGRLFFTSVCRLTRHFLDLVLQDDADAGGYVRGETALPEVDTDLISYRVESAIAQEG